MWFAFFLRPSSAQRTAGRHDGETGFSQGISHRRSVRGNGFGDAFFEWAVQD